jgi:hypothetical protein
VPIGIRGIVVFFEEEKKQSKKNLVGLFLKEGLRFFCWRRRTHETDIKASAASASHTAGCTASVSSDEMQAGTLSCGEGGDASE